MSYRVETASTGRAVCRATECKKKGIKIEKDELRMGTWVDIEDHGGWQWKHWGCVTGYQLQNLRNYLEDPDRPGVYKWDYLDGYEGNEKNSLDKHPDLQEKVQRVITQGFIDPEDFNGDPEMNKLGEKGLRTVKSKKKMRQDQKNRTNEAEELQAKVEALTEERSNLLADGRSTKKVDVKLQAAKDDLESADKKNVVAEKGTKKDPGKGKAQEEEKKTTKRKRGADAKKEDDDDYDEKPSKVSRAAKTKKEPTSKPIKEENDDYPAATAPKKRTAARDSKTIKYEETSESDAEEPSKTESKAPPKGARGGKAVKNEVSDDVDEAADSSKSKIKSRTKKESKKSTKQETSGVKEEALETANSLADIAPARNAKKPRVSGGTSKPATGAETYIPGIKDSDLQYSFDAAVDAGEIEEDFDAYIEQRKAEFAELPPSKKTGGRGKKSAAPKPAASQRARRSKA